jgi:RHS repeat-associated protein
MYGQSALSVEQIKNTTGEVLYLHHNQAGGTRLLTGSTGKAEATFSYGPYGTLTGATGTAATPLGYDAQYTNTDSGLVYMRARVYDPATGQFLTVDLAVSVTQAPYNYGGDNPINEQDRTGLDEEAVYCYPWGCVPGPGGGGSGPASGVEEIIAKNWREVEGGAEKIGEEVASIWNEITGSGGGLPKREEADEKMHGKIPSYPPAGATREELEEAPEDLEASMPIREGELREQGEEKKHRQRLEEERKLRRQIEERKGCGS